MMLSGRGYVDRHAHDASSARSLDRGSGSRVPVAWGFLALVSKLRGWIFTSLPHGLGFHTEPLGPRLR